MTRILALDDHLDLVSMVALVLERVGYDCIVTDDSYEAWALLHTVPFDLFTQDIMRVDIHGIEFYQLMRADAGLDGVPLLMITAKPRPANLEQVFEAGLDGYLTKPFDPEGLTNAIARALRRRGKPVPPQEERKLPQEREVLVKHLEDKQPEERSASLVERLRDERPEERFWAARVLGLRGYDPAIEALREALEDSDVGVRWAAALALGRIGEPRALESLVAALGDEQYLVRMMAAYALGKIGDVRAGGSLVRLLDDESAWVQRVAAHALGEIRDPAATAALERTLRDAAPATKREAAWALGQISGPAVVSLIACLQAEDVAVRRAALGGLSGADPRIEGALIEALDDEDAQVRESAAWKLGFRGARGATDPLVALLRDDNADVAAAAASALGYLRASQALRALEQVAQEDTRQTSRGRTVAHSADWAIQRIQGEGEED